MANSSSPEKKISFDGNFFLKTYYSTVESIDGITEFMMDYYHDIFKSGEISGGTLLDIGTGPSICYIIEQCLKFDHVYLSDFAESNRLALQQWQIDHSFHDHSPFFKYVADKLGDRRTWEDIQAEVERKLRGVLFCDVKAPNPLSPSYFPRFDAITATNCFHAAAESFEEYKAIVRNASTLLKPGGWMLELGHLEETYYIVNDVRINVAYMNKESVCKVWKDEGFTIHDWREFKPESDDRKKITDWKSLFCLAAKKND